MGDAATWVLGQSLRARRANLGGGPASRGTRLSTRTGYLTVVHHTATSVVTIDRFIIEQERQHPEATGELSGILYDIALAAKLISQKVRRAGLVDILGATSDENVQ